MELTLAALAECRHLAISSPTLKLSLEAGGGWARNGFEDFTFNSSGLVGGRCVQRKCGGDRERTGHLVRILPPASRRTRIVFP
ncbi:MAG: hypothetical protein WBF03_02785 [Xanthobacteraceae bacterium]